LIDANLNIMKILAIVSILLTWISIGIFFLLGLLIPITVGVSAVLMPIPIIVIILSFFITRILIQNEKLKTESPKLFERLATVAKIHKTAAKIALWVLVISLICILIGAVIGLILK